MITILKDMVRKLPILAVCLSIVSFSGIGCSTDDGQISSVSSTSSILETSIGNPCELGPEYCYPPISELMAMDGPAPGYVFLKSKAGHAGTLDDDPVSETHAREIRDRRGGQVGISYNLVTIPCTSPSKPPGTHQCNQLS